VSEDGPTSDKRDDCVTPAYFGLITLKLRSSPRALGLLFLASDSPGPILDSFNISNPNFGHFIACSKAGFTQMIVEQEASPYILDIDAHDTSG
jgi:hypothetical protein